VAKYIFRRQSQRHGIDRLDSEKRLDTWFFYLNSLPLVSGQLDRSSYLGFLRAVSLSIPQETAFAEILRRVKNADLHARLNKLEHQQRLAFQYAGEKKWTPGEYNYPPPEREPEFDPEALRRISLKLPDASPRYTYQRSPINPAEVDTERFLQVVFRPGEHAVIFEQFRSQGQLVWNRDLSGIDADQASRLETFKTGCQFGVWFLANPTDGQFHYNPRQGRSSRRSEESITSFRHLILESDEADRDEWIAYLCQLDLPVLAIYSTGGRAPHGLIRIDTATKEAWDRFVHPRIPPLVRHGACRGSLTAVRLSRLPGCRREETNAWQKLHYLNPNPLPRPICELQTLR
jgi:hypothetical protein